MTDPPLRRPWWRRKRIRAAVAAWLSLPVLYVLSIGPACYRRNRGWCGPEDWRPYGPVMAVVGRVPELGIAYSIYQTWWADLAHRHAARY